MASNTTNYGWTKPDYEDDADIMVINETIDNIDASLHEHDEELDVDRATLVELVDSGAKNKATINDLNFTGNSYTIPLPNLTGNIVLSIANVTSTDTDATACLYLIRYADGTTGGNQTLSRNTSHVRSFDLGSNTATGITFYPSDSYAHSAGDTMELTHVMVCSKAAWDISQAYQPYRSSYDEIIARITALENA